MSEVKPTPLAYAYIYSDHFGREVMRFQTGGREINGGKPLRSIAVYDEATLAAERAKAARLLVAVRMVASIVAHKEGGRTTAEIERDYSDLRVVALDALKDTTDA